MCKFCKADDRDEICNPIFKKTLPFGQMNFVTELHVIGDNDSVSLLLDMYEKEWQAQIYDRSIPIKYCPFCGRKLPKEIES